MQQFDDQKLMQKIIKEVKEGNMKRKRKNKLGEVEKKQSFADRFVGKRIFIGKMGVFEALSGDQHCSGRSPNKKYPSDSKIQRISKQKNQKSDLIDKFRNQREPDDSKLINQIKNNKSMKNKLKIQNEMNKKESNRMLQNNSLDKQRPKRVQSQRAIKKVQKRSQNNSQEQTELQKQMIMLKKMRTQQIPSSRNYRIQTSVDLDIEDYRGRVLEKQHLLNLRKLPKIANVNKSERLIRSKVMMSEPSSPRSKPKKFFQAYFQDEQTLKHFKILQRFQRKINLIHKQHISNETSAFPTKR